MRELFGLEAFTVTMYWSAYLVMKFNFLLRDSGQKISNTRLVGHGFCCHCIYQLLKKVKVLGEHMIDSPSHS